MAKPGGAAYSDPSSAAGLSETASGVFQHLGEASRRLMELQAQAAMLLLMDSAVRQADVLHGILRSVGWPYWFRLQRSQMRSLMEPIAVAAEAMTGLQAVLAASFMQSCALVLMPPPLAQETGLQDLVPERRFNSVVIQFPERRRGAKA